MLVKYSVNDVDFYNFNKTGFIMGMIRRIIVVTRANHYSNLKLV
jgi:hypothetical protein